MPRALREQQQDTKQQTANVDRACFAGSSNRQMDTLTCDMLPVRFVGRAQSNMVVSTPQGSEDHGAQPCPLDANADTAADVTMANPAGDAASSTTCLMQLADSSCADDNAIQDRTTEGTTTEGY